MKESTAVVIASLGQLLMGVDKPVPTEELKVMSEEEIRTFNDPEPGTDYGWDTMSESDKNMFRNGGHIPNPNLKTFSDLMRDREAIDMEPVLPKIEQEE